MRRQQSVDLGARRGVAVVHELRTRDMRLLLEQAPDPGGIALDTLLRDHLPLVLTLADTALTLPAGLTLDDLSASEWEALLAAWLELHQRFFPLALALLGAGRQPEAPPPRAPSTAPVSP